MHPERIAQSTQSDLFLRLTWVGKPRWKWSVANESLGKRRLRYMFTANLGVGGEMYGYLESGFANVPKECLLKEDEEGYPWRAPPENGMPYNSSGNSLEMSNPE